VELGRPGYAYPINLDLLDWNLRFHRKMHLYGTAKEIIEDNETYTFEDWDQFLDAIGQLPFKSPESEARQSKQLSESAILALPEVPLPRGALLLSRAGGKYEGEVIGHGQHAIIGDIAWTHAGIYRGDNLQWEFAGWPSTKVQERKISQKIYYAVWGGDMGNFSGAQFEQTIGPYMAKAQGGPKYEAALSWETQEKEPFLERIKPGVVPHESFCADMVARAYATQATNPPEEFGGIAHLYSWVQRELHPTEERILIWHRNTWRDWSQLEQLR
jgi:hypothetical protein